VFLQAEDKLFNVYITKTLLIMLHE